MALTLSDVLTSLAYRLGENSSPTNTNEKARRIRFINQAYRKVSTHRDFWWMEESTTLNSVALQETYTVNDGFPSDYKEMIELRIDSVLYTKLPKTKIFGIYDSTFQSFSYDSFYLEKHYYIYENSLYLRPAYTTSTVNGISMKYYKYPTAVSSESDTFLIPDTYLELLSAFAYGRIMQLKGDRGAAADGFGEYEEILKEMNADHLKRELSGTRIVNEEFLSE